MLAQYQTKYLALHMSLTDCCVIQNSLQQCISCITVSVHKIANYTGNTEEQDMSQTYFH